jgi:hypothetical protein
MQCWLHSLARKVTWGSKVQYEVTPFADIHGVRLRRCSGAVVAGAQLNYSQIEIYSQEVDARIVFARSTALLTLVHRAKSASSEKVERRHRLWPQL